MNPRWNEDFKAHEGGELGLRNSRFRGAMRLAVGELYSSFRDLATSWWPARAVVEGALKKEARLAVHLSGKAAALPSYAPWQSHVSDLEEEGFEGLKEGDLLYMLFPDSTRGFRIQCVGVKGGGFANRKSMPEPWRGVRDEKCSEVVGSRAVLLCMRLASSGAMKLLQV